MSILTAALGIDGIAGAVTAVSGTVGDIIKRFVPDPDKALEAKVELDKLAASAAGAAITASQAVMVADSQSDSKLTKNARPIVVYWSLGVVTLIVGLGTFGLADGVVKALAQVPGELWDTIKVGVGIFAVGRSTEKVTSTVADAIKSVIARKK